MMNADERAAWIRIAGWLGSRNPTRAEWDVAIAAGWRGSNGSSLSTDTICGVRIGITTAEYDAVRGGADWHDYGYYVCRFLTWHSLLTSEGIETLRGFCDLKMHADLLARRREAWRWTRFGLYRGRVYARWFSVATFGAQSILPIPDLEGYGPS